MIGDVAQRASLAQTGRPWWQVCCIGCLLFAITAAIAAYAIVRVLSGPGPQPIVSLPKNLPSDILIPHLAEASSMTYLPGSGRSKSLELISRPISWLDQSSSSTEVRRGVQRFATLISGMDRVTVRWIQLNVSPQDLFAELEKLFVSGGFREEVVKDEKLSAISAVAKRADAVIQFVMKDTPENLGIDEILMLVDYIPISNR